MNRKIISFSEISIQHEKKFKEFSNATLIFNGNFLQSNLQKTVEVLGLMKRYNIVPLENGVCSAVEKALTENILDESNAFISKNLIRGTEENRDKLAEAFIYYTETKRKYIIKNRTLYLGEILNLYQGLETHELIISKDLPINEELFDMFSEIEYDVDKIVLPLKRICDYGFATKIGNYKIVSTAAKAVKHEPIFGEKTKNLPLCFYDGKEIFGISSYDIIYNYEPTQISVCIFENVDNDEVLFFKIFTAKKISIWFNGCKSMIMGIGKNSTPSNYVEYSLENIVRGQYTIRQEEFLVNRISPPIHSPLSSPVEK